MFELSTFAKEVHRNAVEHGWWEKPRSAAAIRALIHDEWSEALEEARAGRPLVWHKCNDQALGQVICEDQKECPCKLDAWETDCAAYDAKPEGIAVELIDGCLRILDYMEHEGEVGEGLTVNECIRLGEEEARIETGKPVGMLDVEEVVDTLHTLTAESRNWKGKKIYLRATFGLAFAWVISRGLNPETLIQQKHRYNKTRPYKHGKRF